MSAEKSAKLFELDVIDGNLAKGIISRDDVLAFLDRTIHVRNIRRKVILSTVVEMLGQGLSAADVCAKAGVDVQGAPVDPDPLATFLNDKVLSASFFGADKQRVLDLLADNATDKDRLSVLFDLRVRERNLARGLITKTEVAVYQAAQEDCAANGEFSKVTVQHTHGYRDGEGEPLSQDEV